VRVVKQRNHPGFWWKWEVFVKMAGWKGITQKPVHRPLRLWVSIYPAAVDDENQYVDVMQIRERIFQ